MSLIIPQDYDPKLSIRDTEAAIRFIRENFQDEFGHELHLLGYFLDKKKSTTDMRFKFLVIFSSIACAILIVGIFFALGSESLMTKVIEFLNNLLGNTDGENSIVLPNN